MLIAALCAGAVPAGAQSAAREDALEERIRREYRAIERSVVRIRTVADLEYVTPDPVSGLRAVLKRPLSVHGTGVVIGRIRVKDRWEYLVLTNHHVADVSNYVITDGRFMRENKRNTQAVPSVEEQSHLVRDESGADDIALIELARDVRGDMALLRTVGAPDDLTPAPFAIGYAPGAIRPGARVITSGYPHDGARITELGHVLEVGRHHELGIPHTDFTVDLPVEQGQSGSPVFLVEVEETPAGARTRFTLIGLLHASERGERYMVPFELWQASLAPAAQALADRLVR